jgi:hypothetical protein
MILASNGIIAGKGTPPSSLLTNLLSVYKAENNANDSLGTNNGTGMGGLLYSSGKSNQSFIFNGSTAYIALSDNSLNFTDDFTATAWFYTPSAAYAHSGIVGNYNYGTRTGWGVYTYQNKLYCEIYNPSGSYSTVYIDNSVVGAWNQVVMVFKKNTGFYLYMNGVLRDSFTTSNNANAGTSPAYSATQRAYIGVLNYSGDWWYAGNGYKIDEVYIWNRALTATEITELYNSGSGKFYPF